MVHGHVLSRVQRMGNEGRAIVRAKRYCKIRAMVAAPQQPRSDRTLGSDICPWRCMTRLWIKPCGVPHPKCCEKYLSSGPNFEQNVPNPYQTRPRLRRGRGPGLAFYSRRARYTDRPLSINVFQIDSGGGQVGISDVESNLTFYSLSVVLQVRDVHVLSWGTRPVASVRRR